jgi:hypothetical protein
MAVSRPGSVRPVDAGTAPGLGSRRGRYKAQLRRRPKAKSLFEPLRWLTR